MKEEKRWDQGDRPTLHGYAHLLILAGTVTICIAVLWRGVHERVAHDGVIFGHVGERRIRG